MSHSSPRLCVPLPPRPPPQARVPPHSLPFDPPHSLSPPTPLLPFLRRRQPSPPNDEPKGLLLGIVQRWGTEWLLFCALKGPGSSTAREQEVASPGHGRATWPVLPPRRRLPSSRSGCSRCSRCPRSYSGDGAADASGGLDEQDDAHSPAPGPPLPPPAPPTLQPNGVYVSKQVVEENLDDYVAYSYVVHHCLSREATDNYLLQRRFSGTCRTPHAFSEMVAAGVDLPTQKFNCCPNSSVALTADRKALTACDVGEAPRHRADEKPAKQAT